MIHNYFISKARARGLQHEDMENHHSTLLNEPVGEEVHQREPSLQRSAATAGKAFAKLTRPSICRLLNMCNEQYMGVYKNNTVSNSLQKMIMH